MQGRGDKPNRPNREGDNAIDWLKGPLDHGPELLGVRPLNIIWTGRGYMGLGLLMAVIFWAILRIHDKKCPLDYIRL